MQRRNMVGVVILLALGALVTVLAASRNTVVQASGSSYSPACTPSAARTPGPDPTSGAAIYTRTVTVDFNNGDPVLRDSLVLAMPAAWPSARELLDDPNTPQFRATLYCALGANQFWSRSNPPDVQLRGGAVVVVDNFQEPVTSAFAVRRRDIGTAFAAPQTDGTWLLTVAPLDGLSATPCTDLTVNAPLGSLSATDGDPPDTKAPQTATYASCNTSHAVLVRPDFKTVLYTDAMQPGLSALNRLIDSLPAALAAVAFIVLIARDKRRRHSQGGDWTPGRATGLVERLVYGRRDDEQTASTTAGGRGWSVEALLIPVLVITGVTFVNEIVIDQGEVDSPWPYRSLLLIIVVAWWVGLRWRLSPGPVTVTAVVGLSCWISA